MLSVYVILVDPAATGVTVPEVVVVLIVAFVTSDDDHALLAAAVPEPVKIVVEPIQTVAVPEIVGLAFNVWVPPALVVPALVLVEVKLDVVIALTAIVALSVAAAAKSTVIQK